MKITKKIQVSTLVLLTVICVSMTSCQKSQDTLTSKNPVPNESANAVFAKENTKVRALLEKIYEKNNADDAETLLKEYRSLNSEEISTFNELRVEYDISKLDTLLNAGDPRLSSLGKDQLETIRSEIRNAGKIRMEMTLLSQQMYGKGINNINGLQIENLYKGVRSQNNVVINACAPITYNNTAYVRNAAGATWTQWYWITKSGQSDCDYNFVFPGTKNRMRGEDVYGVGLLSDLGNQTSMRNTGPATDVILGLGRFTYWVGIPYYLSMSMHFY